MRFYFTGCISWNIFLIVEKMYLVADFFWSLGVTKTHNIYFLNTYN